MIFWMDPKLRPPADLKDADLYEEVIKLQPIDDYHVKQGRSTGRYLMPTSGGPLDVYVKKYYSLPWWQRWFLAPGSYPGPRELANIQRAMELGIKVAEPVVAGADPAQSCKSLLALRSLEGFVALHHDIPARWQATGSSREQRRAWRVFKKSLTGRIAGIVRELHAAGLFHRDLYLCHFFLKVDAASPGGFDLVLIDWGRLKASKRKRWQVKDLAQLLFSARLPGVSQTDTVRFCREYFGVTKLREVDRGLLRAIISKAESYHRHEAKSQRRRAA